jgi:hypothetical protein
MSDQPIWPLPWRIAAALALESGLDWARWAYGDYYCDCDTGAMIAPGVKYTDGQAVVCPTCGLAWQVSCDAESDPYVLTDFDLCIADPSDAEAYRADCRRRGVEPGPMPALEYLGPDVSWRVRAHLEGDTDVEIWLTRGGVALDLYPGGVVQIDSTGMSTADLARLSALATAAARAMGAG